MGSASLFFHLVPRRAILSDLNAKLVECFEQVKSAPDAVAREMLTLKNTPDNYYRVRAQDETLLAPETRAARFIYLNRYCFNGLYRTNKSGRFNVPYGGGRTGALPGFDELLTASMMLTDSKFVCSDFESVIRRYARCGDFIYLDPPYAKQNESLDMQYGPDNFGMRDLRRLADTLSHLDALGASFLVSYADCAEAREHLGIWPSRKVWVNRSIAANVNARVKAGELLISNVRGWA